MCSTQIAAESHGVWKLSRKLKNGGPFGQGASLRPPWHDTQAELVWRRVLTLAWSLVPRGIVRDPHLWLLASGVSVQAHSSITGPIRRLTLSPEGYLCVTFRPGPQCLAAPSRLCSSTGSRGVAPLESLADGPWCSPASLPFNRSS
jgi:hypothetical protein